MVKKSKEKTLTAHQNGHKQGENLEPKPHNEGRRMIFQMFWLTQYMICQFRFQYGDRKQELTWCISEWMDGGKLLVLLLLASFCRYWQKCIRELENAAQRYLFGSAFISQQLSFFTCPLLAWVCHSYNKELRDATKFFAPVHCSVGNSAWIFFDFGDKFPSWSRTLKFFLDMSKNLS